MHLDGHLFPQISFENSHNRPTAKAHQCRESELTQHQGACRRVRTLSAALG